MVMSRGGHRMQVNIHTAKTQLSKLIEAALAGEDVVIAKGATPVVKLVPVRSGQFRLGLLKDRLTSEAPDFLAPLDAEELDRWEGR